MRSIMITGASGLLGRSLMQEFSASFNVIGCAFSRATTPLYKLDLADKQAVLVFLDDHQPDILVHAAAERRPDQCQQHPEATKQINVAATKFLAEACRERGIRFCFISTDYVFAGTHPPYSEQAKPEPVNFYGVTKYAAEQAILADSEQHTIVRVPVLYGDVEYLGESAVTVIAEQLLREHCVQDHWAIRYPTHVEDIALTLRDLFTQHDCSGIYHISAKQALTKYEMACIMAQVQGLPTTTITANTTPSDDATRPHDCALADTRLAALGIHHQRDFSQAIAAIIKQQAS
ncbi:dTDP-4-dehydrorhamnose reductase family protein [Pseudoalteromonas 'SMAR']|uniref:dTDP-4-dehydrorhamnose reductase family protein n=1 Tax=Pseudoalteromonas 'SMAR' TaxID=3416908 RepID=UPI003AF2263F